MSSVTLLILVPTVFFSFFTMLYAVFYTFQAMQKRNRASKHAKEITETKIKRCPLCKSDNLIPGQFLMGGAAIPVIRTEHKKETGVVVVKCKDCGFVMWFSEPEGLPTPGLTALQLGMLIVIIALVILIAAVIFAPGPVSSLLNG